MRFGRRHVSAIVIVMLLVGGAFTYASFRRDIDSAHERIAAGSNVLGTPCGTIEYAERGSGPPLLVVHGAGGGFDQGLLIGENFVATGYRTIAPSRFGYLGTPLPDDGGAAAQADAFVCLLDALGLERVVVLGVSAGAPSSLELAIRHPERVSALVLIVPAAYLPEGGGAGATPPPGLDLVFGTALRFDFPWWLGSKVARSWLIGTVLATPPELVAKATPENAATVYRMLEAVLPVSLRRLGLLNDAQVTTSMQRLALERIRAPTLIVSAEDDRYGTYERARYTAGEIEGASFVGYPTGGHLLVGRGAELKTELARFLARNGSPPGDDP